MSSVIISATHQSIMELKRQRIRTFRITGAVGVVGAAAAAAGGEVAAEPEMVLLARTTVESPADSAETLQRE